MHTQFRRRGAVHALFCGAVFGASALALAACGDSAASLAARDHVAPGEIAADDGRVQQTSAPIRLSAASRETTAPQARPGDIAWAASRRASGDENARARFERYGAEFEAASAEAYAARAAAFLRRPPAGAETVTRVNGDRLVYDAKSNIFAVSDSDGLPRTFFHPRDGATYWAEQKALEARRTASQRAASSEG